MTPSTTRGAFLGGGIALAVAAGVEKLPSVLTKQQHRLHFDSGRLSSAGGVPSFGTLQPTPGSQAPLAGDLFHRGTSRPAGRLSITTIASESGLLRVHSLDLAGGTVVSIGAANDTSFAISSGTRAYAKARGSMSVRSRHDGALALDLELEL